MDFRGNKGDTIYLPYISNFSVNNKVSGQPVEFQSWSEERWQMIINRYREVSFALDKMTEIQSQNDLRSIYTERAGFALSRDIEYAILAERATINGYNTASNVITSGAPLDYTDILAGIEILELANVPLKSIRLVISPKQHASLLTQDEFISNDYSRISGLGTGSRGLVGVIQSLGVPVYVTTSLGTNDTDGFFNGDSDAGSPTPGMTSSFYYPTQSPALRDGTSVTADMGVSYSTLKLAKDKHDIVMATRRPIDMEDENRERLVMIKLKSQKTIETHIVVDVIQKLHSDNEELRKRIKELEAKQ